ncbi:DUF5722 domain-containing protein [Verrucomicrobium spinosum]|uniref:DUF5722 domain-containing protein n=1 Tax=Verrucomicrobium spinosum TaxID=2736 RepID=UPI0012E1D9DF|nr:DUF5722 domain-containing protein [Verrucomicrobium spinosum]
MVDDALALGIRHAGINVNLAALLADAGTAHRVGFRSEDREYFINEDYARSLDRQIKPLSDAGVLVYLILIQYPSRVPEKDAVLIHPKARADGKYIIPPSTPRRRRACATTGL